MAAVARCAQASLPEVFLADIPPALRSNSPVTSDLQPAIRVIMMPRDTNPMGTIFGGLILSYIDQAGAVEARKRTAKPFVTVAMHEVKFIAPVFVGDLVSFYTETIRVGTTSITVRVTVDAQRRDASQTVARVTQAEVVYVAVEAPGKPVPIQ
jgi:acyl-CoA thioesterase YciA